MFRADSLFLSPGKSVATAHLYSLFGFEVSNLPGKWVHWLSELWPGRKPSRDERIEILDEYLVTARRAEKEKDRMEGLLVFQSATVGSVTKEGAPESQEYLDELTATKNRLRPEAEEALEAELSAVIKQLDLDLSLGLIWPPVDVKLDNPPTLLITSSRDRIKLTETVVLDPDLDPLERDRLELEVLEEYDLSALIINLGGIATYPTLVSDLNTLREVMQDSAHEWLHTYLFFRPLGWNYRRTDDMFTLNETVADLAGREIGDIAFERMGGDLTDSATRYQSGEDRDPTFTRLMRETRLQVDELLADGRVEDAEQYMKERWWLLRLGGYRIRKLNQAYFAFFNRYAESGSSVSPIGDQVSEFRDLMPDVGTFLRTIYGVSSYGDFSDLLDRLREEAGQPGQ